MTKSAHCKSLLESLSEYVDGTLSEELCAEIQRHISACQNCSIVVDTLRKTIYLYHATTAEPANVPLDVRERLFHSLKLEDYLQH